MTLTNSLRKGVHRKAWEYCTPLPLSTIAGTCMAGAKLGRSEFMSRIYAFLPGVVGGSFSAYRYDWTQDSWQAIPSLAVSTFNIGVYSTAVFTSKSPNTLIPNAAGTTTTFTTSTLPAINAAGCLIRCVSGAGVGYSGTVVSNTTNRTANTVFTVTPASSVAFDTTSNFQIWSGAVWVNGYGAAGSPSYNFVCYDILTNTWTTKATNNAYGTLVATPSIDYSFYTGQSTDVPSTTTLDDSNASANWATNCWANYQVRITGGTGIGQVRTISSNTTTQLTVSSAWTVTPDATSTYVIEGNDDYLYSIVMVSGNINYRYSISTNTWSSQGGARPTSGTGATYGGGSTADWIAGSTDSQWTTPSSGAAAYRQNGRYIYCFRGNNSSGLDLWDITTGSWQAGTANTGFVYGSAAEPFGPGTSSWSIDDKIYIQNGYGRFFVFDCTANELFPLATSPFPEGAPVSGGAKHVVLKYVESGKELRFLLTLHQGQSTLARMLLI